MVDSWYCLDGSFRRGWARRSEVGNHKQRSLNTRLSSGASAGTFACPAGSYKKCWGEAGTKNEPNRYFVPDRKNSPKIDPHVSNLGFFWFRFRGVPSWRSNQPLFLVLSVRHWTHLESIAPSRMGAIGTEVPQPIQNIWMFADWYAELNGFSLATFCRWVLGQLGQLSGISFDWKSHKVL